MGYRSHVLFAVSQAEDVAMRLQDPRITSLLDTSDRVHNKRWPNGDDYFIYEWDHIKWYESDEDIRALTDWMNTQEEFDEDDYGFAFLRDGEDINDIEHLGSWGFGLTYGIGIEDDNTPRMTDIQRKSLAVVLSMVDGEWGEYMDEDLRKAYDDLLPLVHLT